MIDVTCAIILNADRQVLVTQRSAVMSLPLKMEFPGGKVEPGETPEACLIREIKEELNLDIRLVDKLPANTHIYPGLSIRLIPFICEITGGVLELKEHAAGLWLNPEDLLALDWAAADVPVVKSYLKKNGFYYSFMDNIRTAVPDDAPDIARLMVVAMEDLAAKFTAQPDSESAIPILEIFVRLPSNQYSYENTLVYEDVDGISGMINAYNGANLELLRTPFLDYISSISGKAVEPEQETQAGEYYIDTVSVAVGKQGRGIGQKLLKALIKKASTLQHFTLGLLVSKDNVEAEKLYVKLGFKVINERIFMGGNYLHMQYVGHK